MKLKRASRRCGKSLSASVLLVCVLPMYSGAGGILSCSKYSVFSVSAWASRFLAAMRVFVVSIVATMRFLLSVSLFLAQDKSVQVYFRARMGPAWSPS